jgi:hypothetical protein
MGTLMKQTNMNASQQTQTQTQAQTQMLNNGIQQINKEQTTQTNVAPILVTSLSALPKKLNEEEKQVREKLFFFRRSL